MTVWLKVQPERVHPVARSERPAQATVLPWAPALGVPEELLQAAAVVSGEPRAAEAWVRAAAEPRRVAALAAWAPGARQAVPEAAVSARGGSGPQPGGMLFKNNAPADTTHTVDLTHLRILRTHRDVWE
ncbi:hypothetical protein, partial [Bradyrhizobium canariense]|uniref:hypothetical protein n=1 Tax=Bradyrhizobium canariense TaxID=255045 RepID=UPI0014126449